MPNKVEMSFGTYGTHRHPVIWVKVDKSTCHKYIPIYGIHLPEGDGMSSLEKIISDYLEKGFTVEFVKPNPYEQTKNDNPS